MIELTPSAVRALGCLIEKEVTTPDYYPMTLNALRNACNQKSNRDPVVNYDEKTVVRALDELRENKLAWMVRSTGSRVPKYAHRLEEAFDLPSDQKAVLCMLLLRGPQTAGELKSRCSRMHDFATAAEVELALHKLESREDQALATELPLQPGAREPRFVHLMSGEPDVEQAHAEQPVEAARREVMEEDRRIQALADQVELLKTELDELRQAFQSFKAQFD